MLLWVWLFFQQMTNNDIMILNLFYKEWLKTRWIIIASLIVGLSIVLYIFIELNSAIINSGGKAIYIYNWFTMGGTPHYSLLKNIPVLFAFLIGVFQYYPEVSEKRIKLTLHLPMHNNVLLYSMILYGFIVIISIYLSMLLLYYIFEIFIFPAQINLMSFAAIVPWLLQGLFVYFFVSFVAMEPTLKFRLIYSVTIVAFFFVLFKEPIVYLLILCALLISSLSILYSAERFKIGES